MLSKKRRKKSIRGENKNDLKDISDGEGDNLLHLSVVADIDLKTIKNICSFMSEKYGYFGINCRNNLLQTPLHIASCIGNQDLVKVLIDFGADISLVDRNVENAFHLTVKYGNDSCLQILLSHFKKDKNAINALNRDGLSPLHLCIQSEHQCAHHMIKMIVDSGADINVRDGLSGRTPLLLSLINNKKERVLMKNTLISLNADICLSDYSGLKPIDIMQENDV